MSVPTVTYRIENVEDLPHVHCPTCGALAWSADDVIESPCEHVDLTTHGENEIQYLSPRLLAILEAHEQAEATHEEGEDDDADWDDDSEPDEGCEDDCECEEGDEWTEDWDADRVFPLLTEILESDAYPEVGVLFELNLGPGSFADDDCYYVLFNLQPDAA